MAGKNNTKPAVDYQKERNKYSRHNPDSSRPKDQRWGNKALNGRETIASMGLETAALTGAFMLGGSKAKKALDDAREAGYLARHSGRTLTEIFTGGPEGMQAAENTEDALSSLEMQLKNAKRDFIGNQDAVNNALKQYQAKEEFVSELLDIYRTNETITRQAERLKFQLKGALKHSLEIGNDVKPDGWKEKIDRPIVEAYRWLGEKVGVDIKGYDEAVKESENMKTHFKLGRKFYDLREVDEDTREAYCNHVTEHLDDIASVSKEQNKVIEGLLVDTLKQGYHVEDLLLGREGKADEKDIATLRQIMAKYKTEIMHAREETKEETPLEPYSQNNWVDYATNPLIAAAGIVVIAKGARKILLRGADKTIANAEVWPFKKIGNGASLIYDKVLEHANSNNNKTEGRPYDGGEER